MSIHHPLSIAPMMDYTDRHYRYFMRLITQKTVLYTEMVTTAAILHGDQQKLLGFHVAEHSLSLQLGGSDPADLALCAKIGESFGYDEINLNVGCPSDRVQSGAFGACLLYRPELVAECIQTMQSAVRIPITIKTRIGVDDQDSYDALHRFVDLTHQAGCRSFIFHARKAWLKGLSPKENRTIPELRYDVVYRIKRDFPHLHVGINGGIHTLAEVRQHLQHVDEVMLGRVAVSDPWMFAEVDQSFYGATPVARTREAVLAEYLSYVVSEAEKGERWSFLLKPLMGLYQGQVGARDFRRTVTEAMQTRNLSKIRL